MRKGRGVGLGTGVCLGTIKYCSTGRAPQGGEALVSSAMAGWLGRRGRWRVESTEWEGVARAGRGKAGHDARPWCVVGCRKLILLQGKSVGAEGPTVQQRVTAYESGTAVLRGCCGLGGRRFGRY